MLTDEKATYARIRQLMVNVFPGLVDGDDRFFFYWSGHGTQRDNRRGGQDGFLPLAVSARDDFASMVSMGDIGRWDNAINGRHVLFFLDACLSGLAGTASMTERRQVELNDMVEPAHHLMTAGTSAEETIAGDRWGGSVFTHAFLRAVRGAADTDSLDFPKDGVVSLFELIKHVRDYVPQEARNAGWDKSITPQLRDLGGSDGEFFFVTSEERLAMLERQGETPSGEILGGEAVSKGDETPPLSPERIRQVQEMLSELGFQPGEPDGVLGARTRAAIIAFQRSLSEPATGDLTEAEERQLAIAFADHLTAKRRLSGHSDSTISSWADAVSGSTFRDCAECPEVVVIRPARFLMGSPSTEKERDVNEGPQHVVHIEKPIAIGKYEVTFDEWEDCVFDHGCAHNPVDSGWGRKDRPVINVSYEDAMQYVAWLSEKTGFSYRLPSEAEWEHAARAGTSTPFWTGETISSAEANYNSKRAYGSGGLDRHRKQSIAVGSLLSNQFGLHDILGNVWEWVEDRWHDSYHGAPSNGEAWLEGDDPRRVLRGGSWLSFPWDLRSANRSGFKPDSRVNTFGFRVARTLTP